MKEVKNTIEHIQSIIGSITESEAVKRIAEIAVLVLFLALMLYNCREAKQQIETTKRAQDTDVPDTYNMLHSTYSADEEEEIRDEILYGELELVAQMIQAEAGNQDELGKRYVADVILNRVDDKDFPDKIEDVIFQMDPLQFASIVDGNFEKAGWTVTEDCYKIALEEYEKRTDSEIIYFRTDRYGTGKPKFKHGNHYFSTK